MQIKNYFRFSKFRINEELKRNRLKKRLSLQHWFLVFFSNRFLHFRYFKKYFLSFICNIYNSVFAYLSFPSLSTSDPQLLPPYDYVFLLSPSSLFMLIFSLPLFFFFAVFFFSFFFLYAFFPSFFCFFMHFLPISLSSLCLSSLLFAFFMLFSLPLASLCFSSRSYSLSSCLRKRKHFP